MGEGTVFAILVFTQKPDQDRYKIDWRFHKEVSLLFDPLPVKACRRTLRHAIRFLQGNKIRLVLSDHFGDLLQITFSPFVMFFAVVNVKGHHPDRLRKQGVGEKGNTNEYKKKNFFGRLHTDMIIGDK